MLLMISHDAADNCSAIHWSPKKKERTLRIWGCACQDRSARSVTRLRVGLRAAERSKVPIWNDCIFVCFRHVLLTVYECQCSNRHLLSFSLLKLNGNRKEMPDPSVCHDHRDHGRRKMKKWLQYISLVSGRARATALACTVHTTPRPTPSPSRAALARLAGTATVTASWPSGKPRLRLDRHQLTSHHTVHTNRQFTTRRSAEMGRGLDAHANNPYQPPRQSPDETLPDVRPGR